MGQGDAGHCPWLFAVVCLVEHVQGTITATPDVTAEIYCLLSPREGACRGQSCSLAASWGCASACRKHSLRAVLSP